MEIMCAAYELEKNKIFNKRSGSDTMHTKNVIGIFNERMIDLAIR